jgi:hypothetical protein
MGHPLSISGLSGRPRVLRRFDHTAGGPQGAGEASGLPFSMICTVRTFTALAIVQPTCGAPAGICTRPLLSDAGLVCLRSLEQSRPQGDKRFYAGMSVPVKADV